MAEHTPGPWEVSGKAPCRVNVKINSFLHPLEARIATPEDLEEFGDNCHDDWSICQTDGDMFARSTEECEANARLIAASPDLLAIAKEYVSQCEDAFYDPEDMSEECVTLWNSARAAIAKTTGRECPPPKNIGVPHEERTRRARLIVAAPDLLAACQAAVTALTQNATFPADINMAVATLRTAITKATIP